MAETLAEKVQRAVFSVDTEAGYRLRHIATQMWVLNPLRANDYNHPDEFTSPAGALLGYFTFKDTKEGHNYWHNIYRLLEKSPIL